jgi:hypothetical protein
MRSQIVPALRPSATLAVGRVFYAERGQDFADQSTMGMSARYVEGLGAWMAAHES